MGDDGISATGDAPNLIPVSDEQARAVARLSEFGVTVVTEVSNLARYMGRILGTSPQDLAGLVIGDPLHFVRSTIAAKYDEKLDEIFLRRQTKTLQPVSPSIAIPLLRAAYDEGRPELQELWAGLVASAMDGTRSNNIRISFIETLKQFDPLDALVLNFRDGMQITVHDNAIQLLSDKTRQTGDEIIISVQNLVRLNCVMLHGAISQFSITPYGRALLRACSD